MVGTQPTNQNIFWLWSEDVDFQKRGDTQYWLPIFLENETAVSKFPKLTDLVELKGGATPLGSNYVRDGIPFLRIQNIGENELILDEVVYISEDTHEGLLKRSQLKAGDVLFTITGRIGSVAVVPDEMKAGNINQHMVRMRIKDRNKLLPYYLSTYLLTDYAKLQHERVAYGTTRIALDYPTLYNLKVLVPSPKDQQKVEQIVKEALQLKREASVDYQKSQQLLNQVLGLSDIEKRQELAFWRWSDEINFIEKLHPAAYRIPKIRKVKDFIKIGDYAKDLSYGTSEDLTYQNSGVPFLRITDIDEYFQIDRANIKYISQFDAKKLTKYRALLNDVLISRTGTLGSAILIDKNLQDSIFGSYFIKVRFRQKIKEKLNLEYLIFFINSGIGKAQTNSLSSGGVQTNLTISAIESIEIPFISKSAQDEIVKHLQSFRGKRQLSKQKLQEAKDFVEDLVENRN